jgi:HK97 family phage major capsid protein
MNLLNERSAVYEEMKQILSSEARSESGLAKYEALEAKYKQLTNAIEAEVRFDAIKSSMDKALDQRAISTNTKTSNDEEIRSAFVNYVRTGNVSELRNINSFASSEGGVTIPTILYSAIQRAQADASVMRRIGARVMNTTSTTTLPLTNTAPTALWKNQSNAPGDSGSYADTPQTFSSATLNAYKLTALIKISEEVLYDTSTDLEATVAANVGTSFGNAEEIAFVSGSGVLQPLGLFRTTTAGGNSTLSQDLGSASGSAAVLDALIDGFYKMPQNKRADAVWVVGDGLASVMRKAKASTSGVYLWETSLQAGSPDTFLGKNVYVTQAAPTAWQSTAGIMGCLVNPNFYVIGDRGGYQFQRLSEVYLDQGNIGYRGTKRVDAVLTDGNALVRFKASAA